jgi:3-hydroxyisobutyrate dehydrogenase
MTPDTTNTPAPTLKRIAFLGLGVMGFPMAGHLARAGHHVTVYNRTTSKSQQWAAEYSGQIAVTPALAAQEADIVCCCVGNDDDVRSVTIGQHGAFTSMPAGSIFVDHTTTSVLLAHELYASAAQRNIAFIDAPVSGGQVGAIAGKLTMMCGGDVPAFTQIQPILHAYAPAMTLIGKSGAGQLAKMVNQICIAGVIQSLAEGLAFGLRAGLDMEKVLSVIDKGAAGSWQMQQRGQTMLKNEFDFGFAVDWMRKDLGLCLEQAKQNGALLPNTALIDQFYAEVQNMGGGRWDTSSLIKRLIAFSND